MSDSSETERKPCAHCLVGPHRYGTTDPEHKFSYVACCNSLIGLIEQVAASDVFADSGIEVDVTLDWDLWQTIQRVARRG